jgi:drug/metabolite transporter (DMT)-like permease
MTGSAAGNPGLHFIGLGLAASAFWGASDFLGGLATRKAHVILVVAMAHSLSLGLLLLLAWATHSPIPPPHFALLGICAGAFGGVALILYYQALALGEMGLTTALTGLLTALVPVVFSFVTQGFPKHSQMAGFVLAAVAIALIAYAPAGRPRPLALGLATLAGLGFGVFLVVLQEGNAPSLLWQLIYSRVASATLAGGIVIWVQLGGRAEAATWRREAFENRFFWVAGAAGVLEATGSLLYMVSTRQGRLDVAAVLASLYPVVTILLAAWFLKERTTSSQAVGMVLALGAVVLVSI